MRTEHAPLKVVLQTLKPPIPSAPLSLQGAVDTQSEDIRLQIFVSFVCIYAVGLRTTPHACQRLDPHALDALLAVVNSAAGEVAGLPHQLVTEGTDAILWDGVDKGEIKDGHIWVRDLVRER